MTDWRPYPKNIPKEQKEYLVCREDYVTIACFSFNHKFYDLEGVKYYAPAWINDELGGVISDITAFMEKPKPYQIG